MSTRIERVKELVTLEMFFEEMEWPYTPETRIRCILPDHEDRHPAMQIYPDTQSVHCFACNGGGDVVRLAQLCASPNGREWSLEKAVAWLEDRFSIPKNKTFSLGKRLSKRLDVWRQSVTTTSPRTRAEVENRVISLSEEIASGYPLEVRSNAGYILDYIWDEFTEDVDLVAWGAWAEGFLRGTFTRTLENLSVVTTRSVEIDDRPESLVSALLLDTHFSPAEVVGGYPPLVG